jgi:pre-mRNA-splicing factor RBM22/SLT11
MATIKRDDVKQKWEEAEFPLVCETCLGDNAYVRMTKETHGKKCKICDNPFTVFAWQAGTKGRLKKVEICRTCAQAKNVCQVCIYDLQYGLPVKVRDKVLKEAGSSGAIMAMPQSQANRAWYSAQQERLLAQGENMVGDANALAHAQLSSIARMEPRYERNLPKLCSFFARGECNRGADCPFRHEMPRDRNDPLSKQNTKDRFHGQNDPAAAKLWARLKAKEAEEQKKSTNSEGNDDGFEQAKATLYLRFQGDAPYPLLTEEEIRNHFYAFGEIHSMRIQHDKGQAFVEFTQPEAAELAIVSMNRKTLLDRTILVAWARTPKRGNILAPSRQISNQSSVLQGPQGSLNAVVTIPPPPGGVSKSPLPNGMKPITPPPPGGVSKSPLPNGMKPITPPPEVAAIAAARRAGHISSANSGGGVIRGIGASLAKKIVGTSQPYYPSADPGRLGSRANNPS